MSQQSLSIKTLVWIVSCGFLVLVIMTIVLQTFALPPNKVKHEETDTVTKHTAKNGYTVWEIKNLLSKEECEGLILLASSQGLEDSNVWSFNEKSGNTYDQTHRKSKQTWLQPSASPTTQKVSNISTTLTGIPVENQELLQIAKYEKGGMFNAHFDACKDDDKEYCDKMNNYSGQRRTTLLIYLNDDFEGGETEFVDMDIKIKPETGKAILFYNTYDDETVIPDSHHRGCPVGSGEKWICNVWTHSQAYKHA